MTMLQATKQERWQQIEERCRHIKDALDEPIDSGIFELIVGLNAWQVTTSASCAGHADHGSDAPYVDIEATRDEADKDAERQAHQALFVAQEAAERNRPDEEIRALYQMATKAQQRVGHKHLEVRAKLTDLLSQFYAHRHVPFNARLVIQGEIVQGIGCPMRLECQGSGLQSLATDYTANLQTYQDEMQAFAAFLKMAFFATSS